MTFPSLCKEHIILLKKIPIKEKKKKNIFKKKIKIIKIIIKPNLPNFKRRPAKTIEPKEGASVCANGNQKWKP